MKTKKCITHAVCATVLALYFDAAYPEVDLGREFVKAIKAKQNQTSSITFNPLPFKPLRYER